MAHRVLLAASVLVLVIIQGCAFTPQLDHNALRQILASTPRNAGDVKFITIGQWMPNSKEFNFRNPTPKISGVVVVTDKGILFQQWGGETGLTIIKKISFEDVRSASLISFGLSSRIVILSQQNQYDSFAASELTGEVSIAEGTIEMHKIISALINN